MESPIERMARRIKRHPYAVVLSFLATVVLPLVMIAFSLLTPLAAIAISIIIVSAFLYFLGYKSSTDTQAGQQHEHEEITQPTVEGWGSTADRVRSAVRKWMLHNFGNQARLEHYHQRANAANQYDPLYREAVESLLDDSTWGSVANGAQEWVAIGFETLVNWRSSWNNNGTKNELYRAVIDSLLSQELNLVRGIEFAEHVKAMVAARRLKGG